MWIRLSVVDVYHFYGVIYFGLVDINAFLYVALQEVLKLKSVGGGFVHSSSPKLQNECR